jgi:hypothetical protein
MRVVAVSILRTVELAFGSLVLAWLELKATEARDCWACTPGQVLAHDLLGVSRVLLRLPEKHF